MATREEWLNWYTTRKEERLEPNTQLATNVAMMFTQFEFGVQMGTPFHTLRVTTEEELYKFVSENKPLCVLYDVYTKTLTHRLYVVNFGMRRDTKRLS